MNEREPSRPRKMLFTAIMVLALMIFFELGSMVVLYALGGKIISPGLAASEREFVLRHAASRSNQSTPGNSEETPPEPPGIDVTSEAPEVVHPFLGYVRDPTTEGTRFEHDSLGFFSSPEPRGKRDDRFTVGVFGGSVAVGLARSRELVRELESSPLLAQKRVWVRNFALGGYKQPQQLMALNYALALGERFDVVIQLDGFNDVALAPEEYAATGLNPFYPRRWQHRVAAVPDIEAQRLIGEIAFLEGRRALRATWWSAPLLRWSPTGHLVWKLLDSRTSQRLAFLRDALARQSSSERQYLSLGPQEDFTDDDELLEELSKFWGRSSLQMHRLSEAAGIHYLHFLQPNQYVPGSKTLTHTEKREAFDAGLARAKVIPRAYPRLVREGSSLIAEGVRFHDMSRVFADVEETLYVDSCCHFNQKGMNLLATEIARAILADLEFVPIGT